MPLRQARDGLCKALNQYKYLSRHPARDWREPVAVDGKNMNSSIPKVRLIRKNLFRDTGFFKLEVKALYKKKYALVG
uniref:Uncharacterized protein n=1 Tax=Candidatus Kentrum sp. UNK TaxID=2126344 RepID=A0A451AX41_9GAMM|nr:MAG: hypothetical protein BECKUNK1418G_GA0071005_107413 [Candidatus Kentron sp. UNK]VFK70610.1 MAG: hypothetical protein BECKUNK1418H_GA0071006_103325 [Candidatus Kentron sp. UNK]